MVTSLEHYFSNNPQVKSMERIIETKIENKSLSFYSDNGIFAKSKVDYGSTFLIESFLKFHDKNPLILLDVGCGYGYIGISLVKVLNIEADLIDINTRAICLANKNIVLNKVKAQAFESDIYKNVPKLYDLIITNPPIRAGKEVVLRFLKEAQNHLTENGELWFVMRKDQGVKSVKKEIEKDYLCQIVSKSKGFYVIKEKKR